MQVTTSARVDTRLGDLLAGVERPDGSLAVANSAGELFDIPRDVPEQPLAATPSP